MIIECLDSSLKKYDLHFDVLIFEHPSGDCSPPFKKTCVFYNVYDVSIIIPNK